MTELERLDSKIKELREENAELEAENAILKDEIIELKNVHKAAESLARSSSLTGMSAKYILDTLIDLTGK